MFGDEENVGQEQAGEATGTPATQEAPAAEEAPLPQPTRSLVPPEQLADHEVQCQGCGAIFSKGDTACPNCHKPNQR